MAVMLIVGSLEKLGESVGGREAWAHVRDEVLVGIFGARAGFGDGTQDEEHRFRIDDYWGVDG